MAHALASTANLRGLQDIRKNESNYAEEEGKLRKHNQIDPNRNYMMIYTSKRLTWKQNLLLSFRLEDL